MTTIDLAALIPNDVERLVQPVSPLPERFGMHRVDFDQDDQGRPTTTVTLQEDQHQGAYLYVWTEDGEIRSSADTGEGVENLPEADVEILEQFATEVQRNYDALLRAAVGNLLRNRTFTGELERLAQP